MFTATADALTIFSSEVPVTQALRKQQKQQNNINYWLITQGWSVKRGQLFEVNTV